MWKGIVGQGFTAEEFAGYAQGVTLDLWHPLFVVLHNTAAPKLSEWHSVSGEHRMRNLESYYRDTQGWSAGPHLFVADDKIWAFTSLATSGVHSPSWNNVAWGVEIVGNFDEEEFSDPQKSNVVAALITLHTLGNLDPARLRLHKEDPKTTHHGCPGVNVDKAEIIRLVQAGMPAA